MRQIPLFINRQTGGARTDIQHCRSQFFLLFGQCRTRGGNHRRRGFVIGAGGPFADMRNPGDAHVLDLAPTALDLLGVPQPASFQGRSLLRESR